MNNYCVRRSGLTNAYSVMEFASYRKLQIRAGVDRGSFNICGLSFISQFQYEERMGGFRG